MPDGIRTELAVHNPTNCPVSTISATQEGSVTDINWTGQGANETVTEEFRVSQDISSAVESDFECAEPVVDVGDERVYRFKRNHEEACACEIVESSGAPVADVRARSGVLHLTLHLESVDKLRTIVDKLDDAAERVELRYLVHADASGGSDEPDRALVDRGALTDRQQEVLQTAYSMGYFQYPRDANATTVADELGIGLSTFTEHLAVAQRKLLSELLSQRV
ncbi:helix-turn-helix domain-containing protein [Haloquadratum walsbyi]|jgi:Predicted DNA binding protein|uniref:HTH-10 family transcription regulator n=1 Tax=Haloquadratum walsbyi (strain DSM 16790 / HBSQ001) TaxID=362976 RepID=Q18J21_HALWD|nr:helix-turn-helix domain-containing protein [Haloquadratum walsbyi]CAJ51991.1 HTH-10 family transcription regulator [Haloquadratum walsbyi DSM 16790]